MKLPKKMLVMSVLSMALLAACEDDEEATNVPDNAPTEQENVATPIPADAPFTFTKFSLDADYGNNKNLEVDYDNEATGVEASYENDLSNEKLTGNDAYTKMEEMFKGFTFDVNTPNEDVIKAVKEAFNVGEDYQELEIDIRFADGTEKEYRDVK